MPSYLYHHQSPANRAQKPCFSLVRPCNHSATLSVLWRKAPGYTLIACFAHRPRGSRRARRKKWSLENIHKHLLCIQTFVALIILVYPHCSIAWVGMDGPLLICTLYELIVTKMYTVALRRVSNIILTFLLGGAGMK